jgi:hypothetical protein
MHDQEPKFNKKEKKLTPLKEIQLELEGVNNALKAADSEIKRLEEHENVKNKIVQSQEFKIYTNLNDQRYDLCKRREKLEEELVGTISFFGE